MLTKPYDNINGLSKSSLTKSDSHIPAKDLVPLIFDTLDPKTASLIGRPLTSTIRNHRNSEFSNNSKFISPRSQKLHFQSKGSLKLKDTENPPEKAPITMSIYQFKQFLPQKQEEPSPRDSLGFKKKAVGSSSHRENRNFQFNDNQYQDTISKEGAIENISKPYDFALLKLNQNGAEGSKKSSMNDLSPSTDIEKFDDIVCDMVKSTGPDCFKGSSQRKANPGLVSPRTNARKIVSSSNTNKMTIQPKGSIKEDNKRGLGENNERDGELKRPRDQPMSQTMFRMKEFRRVKDFLLKRNSKLNMNLVTESTGIGKSFTSRPITGIKQSGDNSIAQGKAAYFLENKRSSKGEINDNTPKRNIVEMINFEMHENEKNIQENPVSSNNGIQDLDKRILSLPSESLFPKSINNEPKKPTLHDIQLDEDFIKSWNLRKGSQGTLTVPFNSETQLDRRKSETTLHTRTDKFDMRKFLKFVNCNTPQGISTQVKEDLQSKRKETEQKETIKNENNEKPIQKKEQDQLQQNKEKKKKQKEENIKIQLNQSKQKIKSMFKSSPQKSQTDSPHSKKSPKQSKFIKTNSPKGNDPLRKRVSINQITGLDEISKISMKQFEVSESWEYDNFDIMKKSLKDFL